MKLKMLFIVPIILSSPLFARVVQLDYTQVNVKSIEQKSKNPASEVFEFKRTEQTPERVTISYTFARHKKEDIYIVYKDMTLSFKRAKQLNEGEIETYNIQVTQPNFDQNKIKLEVVATPEQYKSLKNIFKDKFYFKFQEKRKSLRKEEVEKEPVKPTPAFNEEEPLEPEFPSGVKTPPNEKNSSSDEESPREEDQTEE